MKMLMTAMLALSLLSGLVTVSFAQEEKKEEKKGKKKGKKKKENGDAKKQ